MDQSEESTQQQYTAGRAGQLANIPPPFHGMPDGGATSCNNVCVPVSVTIQPPPAAPISTTQHQLVNQDPQAQHVEYVRQRLRQFWANQMQEMKPEDFKKHSIPLNPIKRIMKTDNDVRMIAKESAALLAKACEMFILYMTSQAWNYTEEDGRRTVQNKDIASVINKTDIYDFLEDVIPRDELREARQHVGSSTESNVPQQQLDEQPPMPWLQAQQNPEQPSPSVPQEEQTQDQQQNEKKRKRGPLRL